jgi:diguanylate cyclase (GGDEF)-like protein
VSPEEKSWDRDAFSTLLGRRMAEWRRGGARPSVLLVRIDSFARVDAEHGRRASGLVLRATSQFLRAAIRDMDLLAHYDVGTYVVLLPGSELTNTMKVAERLREAIARCTLPLPSGRLKFTVSLGGAQAEQDDDVAKMMSRTTEALDAAAQSGGNCCYFHNGQWSELAMPAMPQTP